MSAIDDLFIDRKQARQIKLNALRKPAKRPIKYTCECCSKKYRNRPPSAAFYGGRVICAACNKEYTFNRAGDVVTWQEYREWKRTIPKLTFNDLKDVAKEYNSVDEQRKSEIIENMQDHGIGVEVAEDGTLNLNIPLTFMLGIES